jgi:hypothetical protein
VPDEDLHAAPDEDPRLRLIWEEGVRAVDLQAHSIDEVRGRAATILSAASIAGAFLASAVLDGNEAFRLATWIATGAFAVVGLATTWVLWPRSGWKLSRRPRWMLEDYVEHDDPADIDDLLHDLARHLERDLETNKAKLDQLFWGLTIGCGALVVEILAFLWDLQSRR